MPGVASAQPRKHSASDQPDHSGHLFPQHTAVPGRARFKAPVLYRADEIKERVEARLVELDGVHSARVNVLTASLLILSILRFPLRRLPRLSNASWPICRTERHVTIKAGITNDRRGPGLNRAKPWLPGRA